MDEEKDYGWLGWLLMTIAIVGLLVAAKLGWFKP